MDKEQHSSDDTVPSSQSRRDFTITSVLAAAGVGASGVLSPDAANAASAKSPVAFGNGPYPVQGMAAYAPTGPLRLMKFQRRALGPRDVAIQQFLSLFLGGAHIRVMLGLGKPNESEDIRLVRANVELFIRGCRPSGR